MSDEEEARLKEQAFAGVLIALGLHDDLRIRRKAFEAGVPWATKQALADVTRLNKELTDVIRSNVARWGDER